MRVLIELRQLPEGLGATVGLLWDRSKAQVRASDPKVREKGLVLSGEVLAEVLRQQLAKGGADAEMTALHPMIGEWLALVKEQADESRHVDERTAAVDALCRSGLLLLSRDKLPAMSEGSWLQLRGLLVQGWLLALLLLQDDDEEARCMMSRAVSAAVLPQGGAGGDAPGVQAAKAIELAFRHVSEPALGAYEPVWHTFLTSTLNKNAGDGDSIEEGVKGEAGGVGGAERLSDEAMARRLFEKECDNFQAEELLIIQVPPLIYFL
jgi:hypothetical protein